MKLFWQITGVCLLASALMAQATPDGGNPTTFHITGTVVDQSGQPLTGIVVAGGSPFQPGDSGVAVTTGEDGRFSFEGLPAGKYNLVAWRGDEFQRYDGHGELSTAIAVGPGLDPGDLIFRLRPRNVISGRVTDEHNEPVRGAWVKLLARDDGTAAFTYAGQTPTDDEGNFRFGHLAPGRYCLVVLAEPWYAHELASTMESDSEEAPAESLLNVVYAATYYPGGASPNTESPIVLGAGEMVTVDFSLQPVPALSVRLPAPASDEENPIAVSLDQQLLGNETDHFSPRFRSVSPGVVEVSGIRPGRFEAEISVVNQQQESSERSTIHRTVDVSANGEATLEQEHAAIRIQGSARQDNGAVMPQIQGSARQGNGATLPQISMLMLRNLESHRIAVAVISQNGEFQFEERLTPGRYELTSGTTDLFVSSIRAAGARVKGSTIQVGNGASVNLAVTLTQRVGRVNGTAFKDGKPLPGAMIVLVPADAGNNFSLFRRDQSATDGTFTLRDAVAGKYTVLALESGWDLEWSNPEVLKPFLAGGTTVQLRSKETVDVKVNVQVAGGTTE